MISGAVKMITKGKKKVRKNQFGFIYLLSLDGDTDRLRAPERNWVAVKSTYASVTIYDSETDRVSTCGVYHDKKGLYFKKNGKMYRLDIFK